MIKNKIYNISQSEITKIKDEMINDSSLFLVEIDGEKIQTWKDYISEVETKFKFPRSCEFMGDRYLDWITDLSWFKEGEYKENKIDKFAIIIYKYSKFCVNKASTKIEIIDDFYETILPFWEEEVERVVVGGKPKSFNLYLVD